MTFERHEQFQAPTTSDGGLNGTSNTNFLQSSLDFFLLDDIDAFFPSVHSKTNKNENPSLVNNNAYNGSNIDQDQLQHQELFSDIDFSEWVDINEKAESIEHSLNFGDLDIERWISQSSFPSPPLDIDQSPLSEDLFSVPTVNDLQSNEDSISSESIILLASGEHMIESPSVDMIDPFSPPLSSTASSTGSSTKRGGKRSTLSLVDRKLRKKDQNKTAAEKYRLKKKAEKDHILDRHNKLKTINRDLKLEMEDLTFRVEKLKQLMVDLLQVSLPITEIESH